MDSAIIGIIVGAAVGVLPNIVNAFFAHRESQRQREHEFKLKRFDLIVVPRVNAILTFCECIGKCMSVNDNNLDTENNQALYSDYLSAYERLYPYVSFTTREAMEKIGNPLNADVASSDISDLNACLGNELRNAINDANYPAGNAHH